VRRAVFSYAFSFFFSFFFFPFFSPSRGGTRAYEERRRPLPYIAGYEGEKEKEQRAPPFFFFPFFFFLFLSPPSLLTEPVVRAMLGLV